MRSMYRLFRKWLLGYAFIISSLMLPNLLTLVNEDLNRKKDKKGLNII